MPNQIIVDQWTALSAAESRHSSWLINVSIEEILFEKWRTQLHSAALRQMTLLVPKIIAVT